MPNPYEFKGIQSDQAEGLRQLLTKNLVRVVNVISTQRYTGHTQITTNLALALKKRKHEVIILDQLEGKMSIAHHLQLNQTPYDLLDLMMHRRSLQEIIFTSPQNLHMIAISKGLRFFNRLGENDRQWLINNFKILSGKVSVVLVHAGFYQDIQQGVLSSLASQENVLVVTNDPMSLKSAYRLMEKFVQIFSQRRFHILVNKVKSEQEAILIFDKLFEVVSSRLNVLLEYMGHVPFDIKIAQSLQEGQLVCLSHPTSPAAVSFSHLAEVIDNWPYPGASNAGLDHFVQRLITMSKKNGLEQFIQ